MKQGRTETTVQVNEQITEQVNVLPIHINGEITRQALHDSLGLAHQEHFRTSHLLSALGTGLIEMILTNKPNSRRQPYTARGKIHGQ